MIGKLIESLSKRAQEQAQRAARANVKKIHQPRLKRAGRGGAVSAFSAGFRVFARTAKPRSPSAGWNKGLRMETPSAAKKAARIASIINYVTSPTVENARAAGVEPSREKCTYWSSVGFFLSASVEHYIREMTELATAATRGADPIEHVVVSWKPGEKPTRKQVDETVRIMLDEMGLPHHQAIYGAHEDRDHFHIHIIINRVDPLTERVTKINNGFVLEAIHKGIARVEHDQGWSREPNGRYTIVDGIPTRTEAAENLPPITPAAFRDQLRTGLPSAQTIAQQADLTLATNWREAHAAFAAVGCRYHLHRNGAVVVGPDGRPVKASTVSRKFSRPSLEKKFGAYEPEDLPDEKRFTDPERAPARAIQQPALRSAALEDINDAELVDGYVLFNVRQRDMAADRERQAARVLSVDGQDHPRIDHAVRRPQVPGSEPAGGITSLVPHDLLPDWQHFNQTILERAATAKKERLKRQAVRAAEREKLKVSHEDERDILRKYNWRGKGEFLLGFRSAMAAWQRQQRDALAARHEIESTNDPKAPARTTFDRWLEYQGRGADAARFRASAASTPDARAKVKAIHAGSALSPPAKKLPVTPSAKSKESQVVLPPAVAKNAYPPPRGKKRDDTPGGW